ncbi:MAG: Gfo/Idh/MocA family oxidoreductase [Clostridiaceae bacterium]|nr:Gfo/Idh/MocA family oxidoreductase [Clostridiaceae bacterium]
MSRKLKIGFVGTGFMGQVAHLSNYVLLDDCEVVAIAEPRTIVANEVAKRYGIGKIYYNHHELLEKCNVDAIVAVQPFSHHINIIPDILRAKIPVFTEKPIAVSPESGEKLAKLAEENGVLYMVGYNKRSDLAMEYAKDLINEWKSSCEYGKMKLVRITIPPGDWLCGISGANAVNIKEKYPEIQCESPPDYFGEEIGKEYNSFVNYYIHQVNTMRFLFGEPYKVKYVEKTGVLMVTESESGVCGVIEMSPFSKSRGWEETILVGFEKGYIKIELPAPLSSYPGTVTVMRDNHKDVPSLTSPVFMPVSSMKNQAKNFIAAVRGEKPAPCEAAEAAEDLRIARDYICMKYNI